MTKKTPVAVARITVRREIVERLEEYYATPDGQRFKQRFIPASVLSFFLDAPPDVQKAIASRQSPTALAAVMRYAYANQTTKEIPDARDANHAGSRQHIASRN